jgi:hypothetical protein
MCMINFLIIFVTLLEISDPTGRKLCSWTAKPGAAYYDMYK